MRWCWILLTFFMAGCGSGHHTDREVTEPPDHVQGEGQVCRYGTLAPMPEEPPPPCPEGLSCCYPCGLEGCDWVCADAETCASWTTLP